MQSENIPALDVEWSLPYHPVVRLGTWDSHVFAEQVKYTPLQIEPHSTVLDLGANIGAFALWAFHNGAASVNCYEPEDENSQLLRFNTRSYRMNHFPFAVTGDKARMFNIYAGKNRGMHSLINHPDLTIEKQEQVYTHDLERALWLTKPDLMKVDIEYSELTLDWSCLTQFSMLKRFVVEWHFALNAEYKLQAIACHNAIVESGYAPYGGWSIADSGESVLGFYQRVS